MAAIFPYQGKQHTLNVLIAVDDLWLFKLFQNDLTPDEDTVIGDVEEADFDGYDEIIPAWGAIIEDAFGRATSTADVMTWNHDGGATGNIIYGFYVVNTDNNKLLFIERFAAPRSMAVSGDEISILPTLLDGNLAPP